MEWMVKNSDKSAIVDLPELVGDGQPFTAIINKRSVKAAWHPQLKLLSVEVDGVTFNLKVRSFATSRFPGESETTLKTEWYDPEARSIRSVHVTIDQHVPGAANRRAAAACAGKQIRSPLTGKVLTVAVADGEEVAMGQTLMVIEAMKMENKIAATTSGIVQGLKVTAGQSVTAGAELCGIVGS